MSIDQALSGPLDLSDQVRVEQLAFPRLSNEHLIALEPFGKRIRLLKDDYVWQAGQANLCMFVVMSGTMRIHDGRSHKHVASHEEGHFSGDIDVINGRPALVSGIAGTDLELLEIPGDCVRSIVGERPDLGEILLRAFLARRKLLQSRDDVGLLVIGSRFSSETLRLREFLARNRYPFEWEDPDIDKTFDKLLKEFGVHEDETPVVLLPNGDLLKSPSNAVLAERLGVSRPIESKVYDLVVVGAGPAGLAAGVYGASEGLSTLVIDVNSPGGQAGTSSRIENYMGFPLGLTGQDLTDRAVAQAEKFGAQMLVSAGVIGLKCSERGEHWVEIEGMGQVATRCILLASGASYRKLDVPELEKYENRGVYYAATNVERTLCEQAEVAVVGAGNSAGQAAVYMSRTTSRVYLVVRGSDLRKTMSSYLARRIELSDNVEVLLNSEVVQLCGDESLERAVIADRNTGEKHTREIKAIFTMIGAVPHTDWLPERIARDDKGFILTGNDLEIRDIWKEARRPYYLETSCPGVFAAGDARSNSVKRVASAVGEGSMAVAFIHQFFSQ